MMSRPSSRASSTPGSESVNKWKIPHYYRRSSAASSQQSSGSEAGTPVTPGTNSMSSPKKVLVEDPKKGKKRPVYRSRKNSRKKAGEMVFVNYTVQDTAPEEGEVEVPVSELPPMAPSPAIGHKKKSSRSRMLKIFGSSKESPKVEEETHLAAFAENDGVYEPEPYLSASKRSCSSFLRYGRFHHAHSKRSEPSADYAPEEVVPKSSQSPNLVKPASAGIFSGNSSRKVKYLGGMVKNESSVDPGYQNATGMSEAPVVAGKPSDDNDASIAFSKMFSRNGANTSGSMPSLISLNQNAQDQQPHSSHSGTGIPSLKKNMSASSISSLSYRCSPIRTASPARPRSSTRGSYNCGVSLHGVVDTEDGSNPILSATDTYLDSRVGNRNGSILRHKKKQDSISDSHRFYSTSASASTILNNNNSSAVTPSSSSLVTPPPFTPGYSLPSNTSASSTPSVMEYAPGGQPATFSGLANGASTSGHHSSFNIVQPCLERDSSSEIFFGDSDFPTPVDSQPALRGIAKATLKEDEEEFNEREHGIAHGTITNSKRRNSLVRQKGDNLDLVLPHGSSTGSSQVGSILTNSTSSITDTSLMGNWQDSSCYASFDTGMGFKAENFEKAASGRAHKMPTATTAIGRTSSKNSDYMPVGNMDSQGKELGMCAQFDFENAAAFFHEQSKNLTSDYGYTAEQSAQRANTPIDEQASAVTSIANYSPSAAATISMDEAANSSLNYREFDRPHYANPMVHSTSTASQSVAGHSVGQWKSINNDLDAITDSFGISDEINDLPFTYQSIHEEQ